MKKSMCALLGLVSILASGCNKDKQEDQVVSQRYIHKYGYAVSKEEWQTKNYPGQVITHLNNAVTITATYENGYLHGPTTHTFPHSQTVESYFLYNQGELVKEIRYDQMGMPLRETVQLSPTRYTLTVWFAEGTPMSVEEFANEELLDGQYFSLNNEVESRVEKGNGVKLLRDRQGTLLGKETIEGGYVAYQETFFTNGAPESSAHFRLNKLHGEKCTYAETGEPLVIEEWVNGKLHGRSTYFKNGTRYLEVSYLHGAKNGLEVHYVDGETVSQEVQWENDKKHGTVTFYVDGKPQVQYFYDGEQVSQSRYKEMVRLDEMVTDISPDMKTYETIQ